MITLPDEYANIDTATVQSFGDEWSRFDQKTLSDEEASKIFNDYFDIFPWSRLPEKATGFDMGCGSGRWAKLVAYRVGHLHCIDPSRALDVARKNLSDVPNVSFHFGSAEEGILPRASQDFGYALGVLHHLPDTSSGLSACVEMLKPGAPFLVYLYYAFENRSAAFRLVWRCSDFIRRVVSLLPRGVKHLVTDLLALLIYLPLARLTLILERFGYGRVTSIPLSYYRKHSFYTMRTDSRDRFGTPLERRFTQAEIRKMMEDAGLTEIRFSKTAPFWCALGIKK